VAGTAGPQGVQGPPGPAGMECPAGYKPQTITVNAPGGKMPIFACVQG
jgi:hypothetical protein